MSPDKIKLAKIQAQIFIRRADEYQKVQAEVEAKYHVKAVSANTPREAGALRRASMELTRSLAQMRSREGK